MHLHFTRKASAIIRSSETLHCFHLKHTRLPICPRNPNLHSISNLNSISNLTGSCTRTAITRQRSVSSNSVINYLIFSTNLNSKSDIPTKSTSLNLNLSSPDLNSRTTQLNSKALRNPHHCTRLFSTRARAGASFAMAKAGKMTDGELVEAALKRLWDDDTSINASQSTIDIGINLADPSYDKVSMTPWCIPSLCIAKFIRSHASEFWKWLCNSSACMPRISLAPLRESHLFQTLSDFVQDNRYQFESNWWSDCIHSRDCHWVCTLKTNITCAGSQEACRFFCLASFPIQFAIVLSNVKCKWSKSTKKSMHLTLSCHFIFISFHMYPIIIILQREKHQFRVLWMDQWSVLAVNLTLTAQGSNSHV